MMDKRSRVSSKDVAREAGVSQATVSYVLNNVKNIKIKPETRQAVLDAAKKLNYHPSHIARGMRLNKSMAVGVITDRSVTNYNFMKTLEGIKDGLKEHNYAITLLFNRSEDKLNNEILEYYNSHRLDGIIFAFASVDESSREELDNYKIPYIIIDAHATGQDSNEVGSDHLSRLPALAAAFKARGAKSLAYTGPQWRHRTDPRLEAFKTALEVNDIINGGYFLCPFNDEEIIKTVRKILDNKERPDGIMSGSPRFGFHVLKQASYLGIKVPDHLLVASLGTSIFHELCQPSMTSIELPLYDMGRQGAISLVDLMNNISTKNVYILPSEIIMRESL